MTAAPERVRKDLTLLPDDYESGMLSNMKCLWIPRQCQLKLSSCCPPYLNYCKIATLSNCPLPIVNDLKHKTRLAHVYSALLCGNFMTAGPDEFREPAPN